jgi:hypothetical protein
MEGKGLVKKAKFEPIGDILSPETAFIQAANALDVAGTMAIQRQDIEQISNVAALYIELATRLMGGVEEEETESEDDEEVDHEALARKVPLGFSPMVEQPEIIPVEEPECEE